MTITLSNVVGLKEGKHGFHIHANGDCKDPGSHFNPSEVWKNYIPYENHFRKKFVFIFKIQSFNLLQTLQKDHGFIFSTDSDYHSGDFGNIVVDGNSFSEQSFTVSSDIAGIFPDNENNVSKR